MNRNRGFHVIRVKQIELQFAPKISSKESGPKAVFSSQLAHHLRISRRTREWQESEELFVPNGANLLGVRVRSYCRILLAVFLVVSVESFAGTQFNPTTTLTAQTSNNTSAANTFVTQTNGNTGAANVSKMPTRSLLYPGSTARIYAHFLPWFGFGDHMNVGYASNDPAQVQRQVVDMISRGIDGIIINWYGQGTLTHKFSYYDQATQDLMHEAELHPNFNFAIMDDAGSLKACANTVGCDITQTLINDLTYAYNTYENSPAYMYYNGRPVVYFFGQEAYTLDWTRVRASVPGNPLFIFRNGGGFSYAQSNGAFEWVAPETVTATDPLALIYLDNFDKTALSWSTAYSNTSAYKGFNDSLALWGTGRLIQQGCGQTWLTTLAESGRYYSATRQMLGIQLVTWNDYEEGTEMESGIDNCVTVSASVTGTVATWTITGEANTIDHYTVYVSQDGENLMWLADYPTSTTSIDLAPFQLNSGNYILYVQAIGQPSMTNKISAGVSLAIANQAPVAALTVSPTLGYSPVTVTASTAGSSDPDGTIGSSSINFGDGTLVAGASSGHTYAAVGSYTVTAAVTDNSGASSSTSTTVVVKAPEVIVSSPANGASLSSPVHVVAAGFSGFPVTTMQIYVDGKLTVNVPSASLDTNVSMTAGSHALVVKGWDLSGRNFMKSLSITIANPPPTAVLSLSSGSILVGASITASTAGSSDPYGSIVSTQINFGDGTIVTGAGATHQYTVAGTYTVTATVTDNQGATSTASAALVVKKQFVTISSPTAGRVSTSTVQVVGSGFSGYPVVSTQVYLDGVLKYKNSTNSVNISLNLSVGTHSICVQGWDASGATFKAFVTVTR